MIFQIFVIPELKKYRKILVLPKGARHIYIKEESPSEHNFLGKYFVFHLSRSDRHFPTF